MSIQQCANAVVAVVPNRTITMPDGTRLPLRVAFVAIAGRESGWNVRAMGDAYGSCSTCYHPACDGYTSFGYFQVHFWAWASYLKSVTGSSNPCAWKAWLQNPHNSTVAAWHLYQTAQREFGNGFQPWWPDVAGGYAQFPHVTSANPPYRQYLSAAQRAVAAAEQAAARTTHLGTPGAVPISGGTGWAVVGVGILVLGTTAIIADWEGWL